MDTYAVFCNLGTELARILSWEPNLTTSSKGGTVRRLFPRRGRVLARTALVFGVLALPSPARAEGGLDRSFSGGAEASGIYIRYGIPGFLAVEDFLDGGGPAAHAAFNADGTSQSFASSPYPGGTF